MTWAKLGELMRRSYVQTAIMVVVIVVCVVAFWYGLRFVFRTESPLLAVASGSMEPVLYEGDLILIQGMPDVSEIVAAPKDAEPAGDGWLRTSPELHMKRLLAAGMERIFQLGPCFRRGERGPLHHPEFSMLEWYRAEADYRDVLADAKALICAVAAAFDDFSVERLDDVEDPGLPDDNPDGTRSRGHGLFYRY